jgi:hypothetical protein
MAAARAAEYLLPDHLFFSGPDMAAVMASIQILMRVIFHLGFPAAIGANNTLSVSYMYGILLIGSFV